MQVTRCRATPALHALHATDTTQGRHASIEASPVWGRSEGPATARLHAQFGRPRDTCAPASPPKPADRVEP